MIQKKKTMKSKSFPRNWRVTHKQKEHKWRYSFFSFLLLLLSWRQTKTQELTIEKFQSLGPFVFFLTITCGKEKRGEKIIGFFFCFCCFVLFFRSPLFFVLYPLLLIEIITKKRRILSFLFSLCFLSLSLCLANKSEFLQLNYFEWCSSSPVSYSKGRYDK